MSTFVYKAKKPTAETVTGEIHAATQDEAIDLINNLGLVPVDVQQQSDIKKEAPLVSLRVRSKDLYIFSRQISNLLKSGVGLLRSLTIIEEQTQSQTLKKIITNLIYAIKQGRPFSDALSDYPKVFAPIFITMVHAGEESGRLQEMLLNVSTYQQKQEELLSRVRTALAYPVLMLFVGMLTVYFILTFTLPKMMGLFDNMQKSLPLPTKMLLAFSKFLQAGWIWIFLGIGLTAFAINHYRKTPHGKIFFSQLSLKLPLFGPFLLKAELTRFSRTMVLLLKSGVSVTKALEVSIPLISNKIVRDELEQCRVNLIAGESFAQGLRSSPHIPTMMSHLISVGEESGGLCDVLSELSNSFEQETDEQIKIFTTLFEPLMILVIGSIIGFIVFAMLLPVFQFDALSH
jgi:type II secretory pathway component PulF